jgi:hypothetical protein
MTNGLFIHQALYAAANWSNQANVIIIAFFQQLSDPRFAALIA